jgi:phage FluMu protein Com
MKESSISIIPPESTPVYNPINQCWGKKPYRLVRRAMKDCRSLAAENPGMAFTVYKCPHCKKFHVGSVRTE